MIYLYSSSKRVESLSSFINKTQTDLVPDFEKYIKMCEDLCENFSKCFQDLNNLERQMILFKIPFSVNAENVNGADGQLELLDLQSNEALHNPFQGNSSLDFYSWHE